MAKAQSVEDWFASREGAMEPVVHALRTAVQEEGPGLGVKLAWGFPCWHGNERITSILDHAKHCNLQFWSGNRLAKDWPTRIEGTGKQLRHVKVRSVDEIDDELRAIIRKAIELDRVAPEKVR
ncbi:MAG: DUF1801 domain-containing protein [Pseudomonadota bacterium]